MPAEIAESGSSGSSPAVLEDPGERGTATGRTPRSRDGYGIWAARLVTTCGLPPTIGTGRIGAGVFATVVWKCFPPLERLPSADAVRLIDVLWVERSSGAVAAAFEVEHTTSIHSGIVRLLDLALGGEERATHGLFLVAPDARRPTCARNCLGPAFSRVADLDVRYLPYGELDRHRDTMARFGSGMKAIEAVARRLTR